MRIKKGFVLRNICGENVIVAEGKENIDFSKIISMNDTSAFLWEKVASTDFDAERLASLLCDEYDVDKATALADSKTLVEQWRNAGIAE